MPDQFLSLSANELQALLTYHTKKLERENELAALTGYTAIVALSQWMAGDLADKSFSDFYGPKPEPPKRRSIEECERIAREKSLPDVL